MKHRKKDLEVDFIGGAGPLTKEEERLITDFIRSRKLKGSSRKRSVQDGLGKKAAVRTGTQR